MTLLHYLLGFIAVMLVIIALTLAEIAIRIRDVSRTILAAGNAAETAWVQPIADRLDRIIDRAGH